MDIEKQRQCRHNRRRTRGWLAPRA